MTEICKGRFPLRKISIGSDWTFFHLVLSIPSDQKEGREGVKWELGFAHFLAGKMGFHALGLGFINKKTIENGNGIKI